MNQAVLSILRHLLTFGGGFLVAKGLVSEEIITQLAGALPGVIGLLWGAVDEFRAARKAN